MLNESLNRACEIIGGIKFMAAAANPMHNRTLVKLGIIIGMYTIKNKCGYVFTDNVDVHLPDGSLFRPDLTVVKSDNANIITWDGAIYGVPDMVVEVLSKSTRKNDVGIKKDTYESNGVKEYWIVDPFMKIVTVYLLHDGKFSEGDDYIYFSEMELSNLTDAEKADVKTEIKVSIFEDLTIKVEDIFSWGFEE